MSSSGRFPLKPTGEIKCIYIYIFKQREVTLSESSLPMAYQPAMVSSGASDGADLRKNGLSYSLLGEPRAPRTKIRKAANRLVPLQKGANFSLSSAGFTHHRAPKKKHHLRDLNPRILSLTLSFAHAFFAPPQDP